MEYLLFGLLLIAVVAGVSLGVMGEVMLAATYGRIWGRLSEWRARR